MGRAATFDVTYGSRAHRLLGRQSLAVAIVPGVVVDRVERVAGSHGAVYEVWAEQDDAHKRTSRCSPEPSEPRVGTTVQRNPEEARHDE